MEKLQLGRVQKCGCQTFYGLRYGLGQCPAAQRSEAFSIEGISHYGVVVFTQMDSQLVRAAREGKKPDMRELGENGFRFPIGQRFTAFLGSRAHFPSLGPVAADQRVKAPGTGHFSPDDGFVNFFDPSIFKLLR